MKICKIAMCVLSVTGMGATLNSCAIFTDNQSKNISAWSSEISQNDELIAIDLVNALVQFNGMHPANAQLTMTPSNTGFTSALQSVLSAAGYSIGGKARQSSSLVTSYIEQGKQELTGHHRTYMLIVGTIKIKRDYFLQDWGVTPSSNLYVQGADASQIILNDDIFDQPTTQLVADRALTQQAPKSSSELVANTNSQSLDTTAGTVSSAIPAVSMPSPVVTLASASSRDLLVNRARVDRQNMYEIGGSNFSQVFDEFYNVSKTTVVFANDSMRLGQSGKVSINQFLTTFNRDTDVVSVVGCSHGRTSIEDGNKRLAIGRADRVAEALLYAGIPENKVLEEGCWASKPFDEVFPRRGVVLTLKREKRNG